MSLLAKETGENTFETVPEDVYTARCYRMIDLGTQANEFQGKTKYQPKVMISWELIGKDDVRMSEGENVGRPFSVHKRYTLTLDDRGALRADLEKWRGKSFTPTELEGFDLKNIVGQYCTVQVIHSEDGKYANFNSIMTYKGEKPEPVNPNVIFDLDDPDMEVFNSLGEKIQETITKAPEWRAPTVKPSDSIEKKDVVITDIPEDSEQINLDDIPF